MEKAEFIIIAAEDSYFSSLMPPYSYLTKNDWDDQHDKYYPIH